MNTKRLIIIGAVAVAAISITLYFSLSRMNSLTIQGQAIGLDTEVIYLERNYRDDRVVVDSALLTKGGGFKFTIKGASEDPSFYELRCGWDRVPFIGRRGERIHVNSVGNFSSNYIVDGSRESILLREFYQPYLRRGEELRRLGQRYAAEQQAGDEVASGETAKEYMALYNNIKRDQVQFIIANKGSMAAIYALAQRLPGDTFLVGEMTDLIYMRTVADSLSQVYPHSGYLKGLQRDIERIELRSEIFSNVTVRNYPEIDMLDMYGERRTLSSLDGRVVLVDFWSAELGNSNQHNAELKEIYKEFSGAGFEVYQVGIETNKSTWVNVIQAQRLPWISVSDFKGSNSPILGLYNVTRLPSNTLINSAGEVVGRDLYGEALREAVAKETK